jgi:DHA2 family multidrug resistance protein-like MFS transporter
VRRQRKLSDPLVDLNLFRNRAFSASLVILLLGMTTMGGIYLFVTQYIQLVKGLTPLESGLWLLPSALALIAASILTPIITRRVRPGYVVGGALVISAIGYLLLSQVDSVSGLPVLMIGFILIYVGTSPIMVLGSDLVVGSSPPEKAGAASALSETSMEFGFSLGVAILGSIGTAVYRNQVTKDIPTNVPPSVDEATHDNLASATAAVDQLPNELGRYLTRFCPRGVHPRP